MRKMAAEVLHSYVDPSCNGSMERDMQAPEPYSIFTDPRYRVLFSIIKGFRNGAVYGCKVRFPHSLVMTFLFHQGSLKEKALFILQATFQHARNLAFFTAIYRALLAVLGRCLGGAQRWHTFVAAFASGYFVFGKEDKVNTQICLYLLSRITFGFARVAMAKGLVPTPKFNTFPWFAGLMWGCVLWLFEYERHTLQPSLQSSMTYIYQDSQLWHNVWDLVVYNTLPQ